jgi:hypothetical protein
VGSANKQSAEEGGTAQSLIENARDQGQQGSSQPYAQSSVDRLRRSCQTERHHQHNDAHAHAKCSNANVRPRNGCTSPNRVGDVVQAKTDQGMTPAPAANAHAPGQQQAVFGQVIPTVRRVQSRIRHASIGRPSSSACDSASGPAKSDAIRGAAHSNRIGSRVVVRARRHGC